MSAGSAPREGLVTRVLTIPLVSRKLGSACVGGGTGGPCSWGGGTGGPLGTTWPALTFWFLAKLAGLTGVMGVAGVGPSCGASAVSGAGVAAALRFVLLFFWAAACWGEKSISVPRADFWIRFWNIPWPWSS